MLALFLSVAKLWGRGNTAEITGLRRTVIRDGKFQNARTGLVQWLGGSQEKQIGSSYCWILGALPRQFCGIRLSIGDGEFQK